MAKKIKEVIEEVKAVEVELVAKVKSAFHTVCTQFGNVEFTEGKAVVAADKTELIDELHKLNVIEPVQTPEQPVEVPKEAAPTEEVVPVPETSEK